MERHPGDFDRRGVVALCGPDGRIAGAGREAESSPIEETGSTHRSWLFEALKSIVAEMPAAMRRNNGELRAISGHSTADELLSPGGTIPDGSTRDYEEWMMSLDSHRISICGASADDLKITHGPVARSG